MYLSVGQQDSSYVNSYVTTNEPVHSLKPAYLNAVFIDKVLFNEKQWLINIWVEMATCNVSKSLCLIYVIFAL